MSQHGCASHEESGRPLLDFDCMCVTWKPVLIPDDIVAAYCPDCWGWLKGPIRKGTSSDRLRTEHFEALGPSVADVPSQPPAGKSRYARKRQAYREGKPKRDGCRRDHPSWAWILDAKGHHRCKLCERGRQARRRRTVTDSPHTTAGQQS